MKISIVTTVRNRATTIRTALESVARQSLDGFELEHIVIDGASTDGTTDIIRRFADDQKKAPDENDAQKFSFRWLSEPDSGLYDALNKGIRMATGDVIGLLHSDDAFDGDDVLSKIARAFTPEVEATYADVRFVRHIGGPTVRYCTGKYFRPWMFRFGTQVAHTSFFCRKELFDRFGGYSLDYGLYADFDFLLRLLWKGRVAAKYLPFCTTAMTLGGASTGSFKKTVEINRSDLRILRDHGIWSSFLFLYARYALKIWGFVFR